MNIIKNPTERRRLVRFALVGTMGAIIDFGVFNLLTLWLHVPALFASVLSFISAVTNNFLWHRYWTFADSRSKPVTHQLGQFITVNLIGISIRTPIFMFLSTFANWALRQTTRFSSPSDALVHNLALTGAVGIVMFWNFFANRFWTYNDV